MSDPRETQLLHAFVELAEAVVGDFDLSEFLHLLTERACGLLDVDDVGLLLAAGGTLHVMASSSERSRSLELFQLHNEDGPCIDCFRTGAPVIVDDLEAEDKRWPSFVRSALAAGFASAYALPLRLRDERIGVLGLFGETPASLGEFDLLAG